MIILRHAEPDRHLVQKQRLGRGLPRPAQIVARVKGQLVGAGGEIRLSAK